MSISPHPDLALIEPLRLSGEAIIEAVEAVVQRIGPPMADGTNPAAVVDLAPGDATLYRLVLIPGRRWFVGLANDFGAPLYEWSGAWCHWSYAADKYTRDGNEHTARVFVTVLNMTRERLQDLGWFQP